MGLGTPAVHLGRRFGASAMATEGRLVAHRWGNHATLCANHMSIHIGPEITPLVSRTRILLGLTQKGLGERFGVSLRTAHRWELGKSYPSISQVHEIAAAVFPHDASLAAQLASEAGTTLEGLGLVTPPAPLPPAPPPPSQPAPVVVPGPPPRAFPPIALMVDSIVHASNDAAATLGAPGAREAVPPTLRAAVSRARGLGLTTDEIDEALSSGQGLAPKR